MTKTLESTFKPIEAQLTDFANRHNLLVERYWHQEPSWRFGFKHPSGGIGSVDVLATALGAFTIGGYCWIDDYARGVRRAKTTLSPPVELLEVVTTLEETFEMVLKWAREDLSDEAAGFEESWHPNYSEEEFYAFNDKYPTPA